MLPVWVLVTWFPQSTVCTCLHSMTLHTAVIEVLMYLFLKGSSRGQLFIVLQCLTRSLVFSFSSCQILITVISLSGSKHIYISILQFYGEGSTLWIAESSRKFVSNLLFLGSCNIALSIIENLESCLVSILSF